MTKFLKSCNENQYILQECGFHHKGKTLKKMFHLNELQSVVYILLMVSYKLIILSPKIHTYRISKSCCSVEQCLS